MNSAFLGLWAAQPGRVADRGVGATVTNETIGAFIGMRRAIFLKELQ